MFFKKIIILFVSFSLMTSGTFANSSNNYEKPEEPYSKVTTPVSNNKVKGETRMIGPIIRIGSKVASKVINKVFGKKVYKPHTRNKRPSTKKRHQEGEARKKMILSKRKDKRITG